MHVNGCICCQRADSESGVGVHRVSGSRRVGRGTRVYDQPQSGYYDERDAGTVGTQIDQAKGAGIDAFVVSWYGSGNGETTAVLNNVLDRAGERGFRAAAALDIFGGGQNKDSIAASVSYIVNDRANHGAFSVTTVSP